MGFRSYVRHFRGAILELLRPSEAWCFLLVFSHLGTGCKGSQNSQQQQEEKGAKSIIFYGFQKLRQAFSGCNFGASPSFRGMVFPCREVIFFHGVFPSGDQQQQQKPLCSSMRKRQPKFIAAARGKSSQNHHFLWVSEVTLGIFGVQFWGFSVLQRHGVSLPAGDFFHGVFPSGQQQDAAKVAKIHSSSKRKKQPKSSFSMGFRSYVRHFRVQFWGFSVLQRHGVLLPACFFHGVFHPRDQQQQQQKPLQQQEEKVAKIHSSSKRKKEPKSSFSMGFRSYVRHFRGAILGLLRPSEAWCFPAGR